MEGFDPAASFGEEASRRYDADARGDEDETVAFLAQLAGEGDALELAVGTGRIALPLGATGVRVDGIELSPHMVDRLREKPGGSDLDVVVGDTVTQILDINHVRIGSDGIVLGPIRLRLAYPPELDLMARLTGLRLRDRWGGWHGEPFTAASWRHISVYERAGQSLEERP